MDVLSNGGNRTPSSSRRRQERRVDDSPEDEQDVDSEVEPRASNSRRTPRSSTKTLSSLHNGLDDENDENANPALNSTPASSNSVHGKRRRLSTSGRAAAVATPTENGVDEEDDDATPPPPEASGSGSRTPGGQDDEVDPLMAEEMAQVKEEHAKPVFKKQLLLRDKADG